MRPEVHHRHDDGHAVAMLVWHLPAGARVLSSAAVGGGLGPRNWVVNVGVPAGYGRTDLDTHLLGLAAEVGCHGPGVALCTAADVTDVQTWRDGPVTVHATCGVRLPTWAAAPPVGTATPRSPGTINLVVELTDPATDAALVNLVATVTEAKTQALLDEGVAGTGTATDAIAVVAPAGTGTRDANLDTFGGPRSPLGAAAARATHAAVRRGTRASLARIAAERP